jgi:hypothetical protein
MPGTHEIPSPLTGEGQGGGDLGDYFTALGRGTGRGDKNFPTKIKPGLPLQGIPGSYEKIAPGNLKALKLSRSGVLLFDRKFLSDRAFPAQRETPNITVVQGVVSFLQFA